MAKGQGHDTSLGHGQQLCEILSKSNIAVVNFGPDKDHGYVCNVTLILDILGHGQFGHDTSLGHGQQFEILSRSNKTVESYGPDTDFPNVCIVTLILDI